MDTKDSGASNEDVSSRIRNEPKLCIIGCGFYGSPATSNMCSSCFKKESKKAFKGNPIVEVKDIVSNTSGATIAAAAEGDGEDKEDKPKRRVQKNKKRCFTCRKKLGFMGHQCKCGYIFCGTHRYADAHTCDFDYAAENKANLAEKNTDARFAKVDKL